MPYVQIMYDDIYFDQKVQEMCVTSGYKCPYYKHSWSCPPAAPYLEKALSKYERFYLVYSKFDLEKYIKEQKEKKPKRSKKYIKSMYLLKSVKQNLLDDEFDKLLSEINEPYSKKLLLYYGTCTYCQTQNAGECTYDSGEPCRFPKERQYSMEAVGIDVIKTVSKLDVDIGYPSQRYAHKFGLACFK